MRSSALNCIYLTSQLRNQIEPTILKVVFIFISQIEIKFKIIILKYLLDQSTFLKCYTDYLDFLTHSL